MTICTSCLRRIAIAPVYRTQWPQITRRRHSSNSDSSWFQQLREEMLERKLPVLHDLPLEKDEIKLFNTVSGFLPKEWSPPFESENRDGKPADPVGNHLVFFNPSLPAKDLLPDGTDSLHSPGGSFVRRMWAGGSLRVNMSRHFNLHVEGGWKLGSGMVCVERIKDVQLRGQRDAAKIFVTIERRFAKLGRLRKTAQEKTWKSYGVEDPVDILRIQGQGSDEQCGSAFLIEERNLVFMKERGAAELEALKSGTMAAIRYLEPPGQPDFSHTLVPTRQLLFRFSALTFNAHAIHLDREYCRNVEGHPNLLVHGPLTLLLLVKLVSAHLHSLKGRPQVIQSIEYRNLAPLYCDEEMRLCARKKTNTDSEDEGTYDVWIEGPTGGMAVKGTVRTGETVQRWSSCRQKHKKMDDSASD